MIRVTEIATWLTCRQMWSFRYQDSLSRRPRLDEGVSPMLSGSAIHKGVEAMLLAPEGADRREYGLAAAVSYLTRYGEKADKYLRGVTTALEGVPDSLLSIKNPQAETELSVRWADGEVEVSITGHPDLWYYLDDGINVIDFKSTSSDEAKKLEQYNLWNMQPRFYAVMLRDQYPALPLYTTHYILSTRGNHVYGQPRLVTEELLDYSRELMFGTAKEIMGGRAGLLPIIPFYGTYPASCQNCDYNDICIGRLTGSDIGAIIEEGYDKTGGQRG